MATGEVSTPNGMHDRGVVEECWNIGWKERTFIRIHGAGNPVVPDSQRPAWQPPRVLVAVASGWCLVARALHNSTVETQAVRPAVLGGLVVVCIVIATAVVAATVFVASPSVVAACLVRFFIRSEHGFSGCGLGFKGGQLGLKGPKFGVSALVSGS